ncbi:UNVERIFIED_CONTAM: Hypersensitive-induced response protein 4 [Sesamum latifolium]|uniref:Hypersensitive-induced response protein 4 n=1 Tax=Sesamum latifolium TaxID=2727402 RepID=A0AAW2T7Y3_9LAMI
MGNAYCVMCGCVDQASVGVVEKWGRFDRLAQPGLHWFNPLAGECLAGILTTRISSLDVKIETKTKGDVAQAVLEELEKVMGAYGYNIEHILMVDIIPDPSVRKAMNEINAAQRMQLASVYKGEAEKILQVKKAEADAEAKYLGGVGVARQRQAITDGLRENILNFSHKVEGTSAKEVMDLIMITQYFDTIKDLGNSSKNTTVFIPHGPGHVRDIGEQIRNGLMEGSSAHLNVE